MHNILFLLLGYVFLECAWFGLLFGMEANQIIGTAWTKRVYKDRTSRIIACGWISYVRNTDTGSY